MKICNALASLASFTETISIFNQPDQITNFKCLIYSVDRILKQLNLAELTCILKCRLAAPLYPFPSLCFCTIWSLNFRTILSKDSFADCTPKFLTLKETNINKKTECLFWSIHLAWGKSWGCDFPKFSSWNGSWLPSSWKSLESLWIKPHKV